MKKINIILFALLLIFTACDDEQEQLYDNLKSTPVAPALTIEGARNITLKSEMPQMAYSALNWSRANYGKGVTVSYMLEVCNVEDFTSGIESVALGNDVYLKTLDIDQLLGWAEKYGAYNRESKEITKPITLYFRIVGQAAASENGIPSSELAYSNVESISLSQYIEPWEPIEVTIKFLPVSGDWGQYAVYAYGESEVYGGWPGQALEADEDGWYSFVVPTNRPINLIINGNGNQFNFLTDPTESACYEFAIGEGNDNCEWTAVDCPTKYPANLYMIGAEFGNWDWGSSGVAELTPVWGNEGHFWTVRYISAGQGFKWNSVRDWGGDFFSLGDDRGFTTSDGNAFVAQDGMYMVYIDMVDNVISVEPAKVYGMGDCFGNWDKGANPFAVEGKTMTITTAATGEIRMYAASEIAPIGVDWWQMEFVPIDGIIQYRGTGNDQDRVQVDAGKKVILDFNAGTGTVQ